MFLTSTDPAFYQIFVCVRQLIVYLAHITALQFYLLNAFGITIDRIQFIIIL